MPTLVSHPDEVIVLKRRFGQGAADIDKYVELDGYKAVQKAIAARDAGVDHQHDEGQRAARTRRRGLSDRHEVELRAEGSEKPKYVLVNGDESRAGHLQGPRDLP